MKETLRDLLILQDRDMRILARQKEIGDIPARREQILRHMEGAEKALTEARETLKSKTAKMHEVEGAIELLKQQIRRHQEQQFQIKSNTEYKALEKEIAGERGKINGLEDQQLEIMEEMDVERERVASRESAMKEEETQVKEELLLLDERMQVLGKEIEDLQQEREKLAAKIDPVSLARYDRALNHWKGEAIVSIENRTCSGCHMQLPPQVIQDVKHGTELVACTFCNRFLCLK